MAQWSAVSAEIGCVDAGESSLLQSGNLTTLLIDLARPGFHDELANSLR